LWKSEVYGIADYLLEEFKKNPADKMRAEAMSACINADPTDGLGVTNTDLDQLLDDTNVTPRKGYLELELALLGHFEDNIEYKNHAAVRRYLATEFKRRDPINIARERLMWLYG
jgi:hypothetical protein